MSEIISGDDFIAAAISSRLACSIKSISFDISCWVSVVIDALVAISLILHLVYPVWVYRQ